MRSGRTKLVFWQNNLSLHQAPLIRALAARQETEVVVVSFGAISERRRNMGWTIPDFGEAEIIAEAEESDAGSIFERHRLADAHIFSGFGAYPGVANAIAYARKAKGDSKLIVMTEPWDTRGWRGVLRLVRAHARVSSVAAGLDAVLTCGDRAAEQLAKFRRARHLPMYDFGYFVAASPPIDTPADSSTHRLIFVGELSDWKDPVLLIRALRTASDLRWKLQLIGDGSLRAECERAVREAQLEDRVRFSGNLSNELTRAAISESDVLVLPSAYDGWGAVVNEALMDGVRVVVSDAAGAQDLIVDKLVGQRFKSGDEASLAAALRRCMEDGHDLNIRTQIREWAEQRISPDRVAEYVSDIVSAVPYPVTAPWKEPPVVAHNA